MKKIFIILNFIVLSFKGFSTGEPSTYFNIYLPPNNSANAHRDVCLIVTAIYDSTSFNIVDDGMDGDTDDNASGVLMAGQSYILYIRDNGINDDAAGASNGVLKQDGDYFIITSNKLVFASQSTDSDWQHDWLPSVDKKSIGQKFMIYAPKITSSNRDLNVFAYSDSTLIKIKKISTIAKMTTGYTSVNMNSPTTVATFSLNVGEDIIYKYAYGRNILNSGETYMIESSKPITVQYGALYVNERDGGGYVPSSNGSSAGELFYFGVPYQVAGEQEIRIVSWDNLNEVSLERYSNGAWISMKHWSLDHFQPSDWVGKNEGNVAYPTTFRVKCTPGKKISIFEGNWFETGTPGTSDMATMVSSDNGTCSGKNFLVYMAPPGDEQNVRNPFTNTLFGQRLTHVYLFAKNAAVVSVKDSYTNGTKFNKTYTIAAGKYVDCYLTEMEWKNIYNGTGTNSGPARPYLTVTSNEDISLMNSNFNDNWMMYFGSALPQSIIQTSNSNKNNAIPGDTVTFRSDIGFKGTDLVYNPSIEVNVTSGATVSSSKLVDVQNADTINGIINQTVLKTTVSFQGEPTLDPANQYFVETKIVVIPVNSQGTNINNSIVSVETVVTGTVNGETQQSVVNDGLSVNRVVTSDVTPPVIIAPPSQTVNPNSAGCTATINLGIPTTSDNVGVLYTTNNAPANFPVGITVVNWTTYDAAGNNASASQTVVVNAPDILPPSATSLTMCSGYSTTLSVSGASGDVEWWTAQSGGTLIQTGNSYETPLLNGSVTYYVLNNVNGCKSNRVALPVVVKSTPAKPQVNIPQVCSGNDAVLSAVVPSGDVHWYDQYSIMIWNAPTLYTPVLDTSVTYYVSNYANGCEGILDTIHLIVIPTPIKPTASNINICVGSVANLSATTPGGNYQWYDNATGGNLLHNGSSYSISGLTASQNYYVQTTINGCISERSQVVVNVNSTRPDVISPTINGLVLLCNQDDTLTYTSGGANFGYGYVWNVPNGMTIINGQDTRTITVSVDPSTIVSGPVSIYAYNACGISDTRYLEINLPATIAGPSNVCSVNSATYSVHPVTGANYYVWNLPNGMTGSSSTNSITVFISHPDFVSGTISVIAHSSCGQTQARTRVITSALGNPGVINGQSFNVCPGSILVYAISPVANAASYSWSVPAGAIISGSANNTLITSDTSITVTFPLDFQSGNITVSASNGCLNSLVRILQVLKAPALSSPGVIAGSTNVCSLLGSNSPVMYSISPVNGVSSYYWTVPVNATLISGQGSTSILVTFNNNFTAGNISVASVGSCVNSLSRTLGVYKAPGGVGNIDGPTAACHVQAQTVTYSVAPVSDATGYTWNVPSSGTIVSGYNTNIIMVSFNNNVAANSIIKVRATNSCGGSIIRTLTINPCIAGSGSKAQVIENVNPDTYIIGEPYPNPAGELVMIPVQSEVPAEISVAIFNMLGQEIRATKYAVDAGQFEIKLNLENINSGLYYLHIVNPENQQTVIKRMIKN